MSDTVMDIAEGDDAAAPAVRIPITVKHHDTPPDDGADDLALETGGTSEQASNPHGGLGLDFTHFEFLEAASQPSQSSDDEAEDSIVVDYGAVQVEFSDPVADTLVFIAEPDAPGGGTVYPEVEIHFCSTVGNTKTAEREVYLQYEFEPIHAEPLTGEDFTMNFTEIEWL